MLAWIAVGGALGALARWAVGGWVHANLGETFPWGTLVVNATGCLLLGFSLALLEAWPVSPEVRGFVTVGIPGAFTTFSGGLVTLERARVILCRPAGEP